MQWRLTGDWYKDRLVGVMWGQMTWERRLGQWNNGPDNRGGWDHEGTTSSRSPQDSSRPVSGWLGGH